MEHVIYNSIIKSKMDDYAHQVYSITRKFPKDELYGVTSQLRRAALSVVLKYIEGYSRNRIGNKGKMYGNFLEISYGSLKESKYLLHFSLEEKYLTKYQYENVIKLAEEIGAMLWGIIRNLR